MRISGADPLFYVSFTVEHNVRKKVESLNLEFVGKPFLPIIQGAVVPLRS